MIKIEMALWEQLHDLFDTDDGSLPDIELNGLTGAQVEQIYGFLRSQSSLTSPSLSFWSRAQKREVLVDAVPNAARLVVRGEAEPFHVVLCGLSFAGAVIPDLGVFVFPSYLNLDYRMGLQWGPGELAALLECLCRIRSLAPSVEIALPLKEPARERFASALRQYQNGGASE